MRVAWIGLGVMGYPMAGHLVTRGGVSVTVYNRTASNAARWAEAFMGPTAATPPQGSQGPAQQRGEDAHHHPGRHGSSNGGSNGSNSHRATVQDR